MPAEPKYDYKARSEIYLDGIHTFHYVLKHIMDNNLDVRIYDFKLDNEQISFSSNRDYDYILNLIFKTTSKVADNHVIYQSLKYADEYDGERIYGLHPPSDCSKCKTCKKNW